MAKTKELSVDVRQKIVNFHQLGQWMLPSRNGYTSTVQNGGGWIIFNFSIVQADFVFLLIEFIYTFSISYKILPYYFYYYCILIRMW